jgi:hypothetical protein
MCNPLIVSVSSCSIASRIAVDVYLVSFGSYSPCVECGIRANFPPVANMDFGVFCEDVDYPSVNHSALVEGMNTFFVGD